MTDRVCPARGRGGVGYYPESDFVHLDTGRVRRWQARNSRQSVRRVRLGAMPVRVLVSLSLLGLSLLPAGAQAGECRALLRPLLTQADPPATELERVQAVCRAESRDGDPDATYQLSFFLLGLGGVWQPDDALPLIRSAADDGVSEAQYWLAWQSETGPLLPHDDEIALGWYRAAAAANHRLALQRLADAWERGELGLPADPRQSLELRARIRRCEEDSTLTPN